ncbi:hypothetical protein CANMA_003713 [Candida margitis]|uniref:uncharacterized protein n=1 Tax=Candida margitis TaxID=1775924 RepID=UPI002226F4C5|nr:uncharacterized protein CANMA_003713 [Candida margitis]KAI5961736.1 hypothetical protein CANMA_003713 [Candida margitis]
MCGRFAQGMDLNDILNEFNQAISNTNDESVENNVPDSSRVSQWTPSCNIAPTNTALMVYMAEPQEGVTQKYVFEPSKFGLVPSWAKPTDPTPVNKGKQNEGEKYSRELGKHESKYFNCRRESLAEHRAVWSSCKKHRCVVPIQGYFEWLKTKNEKTPYFVHSQTAPLIFLAGFFSHNYNYKDNFNVKDECLSTFTVITAPAEKLDKYDLSWLHTRKTLVIKPGSAAWFKWLDSKREWDDSLIDEVLNTKTNEAYASIEAYQVSNDVGNPSNKSENILKKVNGKKGVSDFFKKHVKQEGENTKGSSIKQEGEDVESSSFKQEPSEDGKEMKVKTESSSQPSSKRSKHGRDDSSKKVKIEGD